MLITISSSGNSENIVRALAWAAQQRHDHHRAVGLFRRPQRPMADISLHVAAENYGVVEDVHQSLMHILAQYVRNQ